MNPNIALSVVRPRFNTPEDKRNALAMDIAAQQQQMQMATMQQQQSELARTTGIRNSLSQIDPSSPDAYRQAQGVYSRAGEFDKAMEIDKHLSTLSKQERDREVAELEAFGKVAPLLMNQETYGQGLQIAGRVAPGLASRLPAEYNPEIAPTIEQLALGAKGYLDKQQADRTFQQNEQKFAHEQAQDATANDLARDRIAASRERTAAVNSGTKAATLTQVSNIRKEFNSGAKEFLSVRDSYKRVEKARPTAAGDMALIYNLMKMFDPGSVVRETEFATAQNAAGVPDQVRNTYNRLLSGERLNPNQRADFTATAQDIMSGALETHRGLEEEYSRIATESGIEPSKVIVDYTKGINLKPKEAEKQPKAQIPAGAMKYPDGNWYAKDAQGRWVQYKE